MMAKEGVVIEIQEGVKKYSNSDYILKGINMSVPQGNIYSLLGPSGCGKTTLLNCIVGMQKLSSGFINMPSIKSPMDFAYMPQDIALETACSIAETFHIYGLMFGISQQLVNKRKQYLIALLNIPNENRLISSLSGGQQRRISLAVALLHDAGTLLLDEPTVGLDPLLCVDIWDYLQEATKKEGKTVIITTHYIDEARRSDMVGFMRDGKILKEGNPVELMEQYGCSNLEDVFITLCMGQKPATTNTANQIQAQKNDEQKTGSTYELQSETFNYNRFKAHVYKDYLWTKRNLILLLGLLTLPISNSLLFCLSFGNYPVDLKVGLYTEEISPSSVSTICAPRSYLRYVDTDYDNTNCSLAQSLSCQYYQRLVEKFDVVVYASIAEAQADVRDNKIWGVISLKQNYSQALMARIIDGRWALDEDVQEATVDVQLDMSNFIIGYHIQDKVRQTLEKIVYFTADNCHLPKGVAKIPIQTVEKYYSGSESVGSGSEAAPFLVGLSFYFALMYTSSALTEEKAAAIINRNKVIGVTSLEIVTGHLVIQFLIMTIQKLSMLFILYVPFDYTLNGSLLLVLIGLYLVEAVAIALGVLFSKLFVSPIPMNSTTIFFTIAIFFLGGCAWPEEALHWSLQKIKWIFPAQLLVGSLRIIIVKNFGLMHPTVITGFLSCVVWIVFLSFATYIISKFK